MTPPIRPEAPSLLDLIERQRPMARDATATPGYRPRPVPTNGARPAWKDELLRQIARSLQPSTDDPWTDLPQAPVSQPRRAESVGQRPDAARVNMDPNYDAGLFRPSLPLEVAGGIVNYAVQHPIRTAMDFVPGVGDALSAKDAVTDAREGRYGSAALNALAAIPVVGAVGDVAKRGKKALNAVEEAGDVGRAVERAFVPPSAPLMTYHGTPHRFAPEPGHPLGRFRMEKLGTGEGAQMYGHGLYFADDVDVAKTYAPRNEAYEQTLLREYQRAERANDYDTMEVLESAMLHDTHDQLAAKYADRPEARRGLGIVKKAAPPGTHGVYEVAIDASPDELLDWDIPMSQQSDLVLQRLGFERSRDAGNKAFEDLLAEAQAAGKTLSDPEFKPRYDALNARLDRTIGTAGVPDVTGGEFYRSSDDMLHLSADEFKKAELGRSEWLRERGIPGIRYLDGDSRAAGRGTRNYVIWDESKLRILRALAAVGMVSGAALAKAEQEAAAQQRGKPDA